MLGVSHLPKDNDLGFCAHIGELLFGLALFLRDDEKGLEAQWIDRFMYRRSLMFIWGFTYTDAVLCAPMTAVMRVHLAKCATSHRYAGIR
jgi:hypothetical protein